MVSRDLLLTKVTEAHVPDDTTPQLTGDVDE